MNIQEVIEKVGNEMVHANECPAYDSIINSNCDCYVGAIIDYLNELHNTLLACRDCNDNGEGYNSPTANSAQALADLFSMIG